MADKELGECQYNILRIALISMRRESPD